MPLKSGTRLGAYEILSPLGAGSMGEVYRASDSKLQREVALKVLPASFTHDAERVTRFEREAQILASLNHPHVAAIYGLEAAEGYQFLVLELVPGETLDIRIAHGPMRMDEALAIARQIASALEAAHDKGIVHRDLKPANIAVTPDGEVKVLDFGLAKAIDATREATADALTIAAPAVTTGVGVILGTAAYMSPEQAKGRAVDKRADIWAFGVVLFEMLSGSRLFGGDTISEALAEVLKEEPVWSALPPDTPPAVRRLLARCLNKDPRLRLRDMGDARLDLDESLADAPLTPRHARRARFAGIAAAVGAGAIVTALAAAVVALWWPRAPDAPVSRLSVLAPAGATLFPDASESAISPDGQSIVFRTGHTVGPGQAGSGSQLWIRHLAETVAKPIPGTEDAFLPFWSPNGRSIGFFMQGKLKTVAIASGTISEICDTNEGRGATWGADDTIVFAPAPQGPLMRVSVGGGNPRPLTRLDAARQEIAHRFPSFLPDGRHFLFAALSNRSDVDIFLGSVDAADVTLLVTADTAATYSAPGYLLFMSKGLLKAQRFDSRRMTLVGEPTAIGSDDPVIGGEYTAGRAVSASDTGTLVYLGVSRRNTRLVWLDTASGREVGTVAMPAARYDDVRIAPDGKHAAVQRAVSATESDIWIVELPNGGGVPLTSGTGFKRQPRWSSDSKRVVFSSSRNGGDFFVKAIGSASPEQPLHVPGDMFTQLDDWSPDDRFILFEQLDSKTGADLWILPLDGSPPKPYLTTSSHESNASFSPDGRWVAYTSDEGGTPDLWVQSFPTPGTPIRVTTEGVLGGGWTASGRLVYARARDREMFSRAVEQGPPLHLGPPRTLATLPTDLVGVHGDESRLLASRLVGESAPASLTVVFNWAAALSIR